jgi:histidine triad (HIT) family protein
MCLFCKIAGKEIPAQIVYEDAHVIAFRDIKPQAPVHILVIPKQHIPSLNELTDPAVAGYLTAAVRTIAVREKLVNGYRVVINTGPDSGQEVAHLHYHLLGGRKMTWPPG